LNQEVSSQPWALFFYVNGYITIIIMTCPWGFARNESKECNDYGLDFSVNLKLYLGYIQE